MQDRLLDILILGLLVLLFAVIYRKRANLRLRFWIVGWLFVLTHFAVLVPQPSTDFWQRLQAAVGMAGLLLGGLCFFLAAVAFALPRRKLAMLGAGIGLLPFLYIFLAIFKTRDVNLLLATAIVTEAVILWMNWHFRRGSRSIFLIHTVSAVACGAWLLRLIAVGQGDLGIYALLTQIFLADAVLFWSDFQRISVGVITASAGLLAWASVFPVALTFARFFPAIRIPGELWNIPKYFVEFGMILTLMENQVYSANWQTEQYRVLFDNNPYPMLIYDAKSLVILRANDAALQQYRYTRAEMLNMTVARLHDLAALTGIERLLSETRSPSGVSGPWTQRRKDGSEFQAELSSHSIEFEGRDARLCMAQDVTDRQRLHEQLVHRAHHDSLTGLPNRFLLEQRMIHTLESASRNGHKAAILCLDLDHFKQINDCYGHAAGDACLQEIAARLTSRLRESDTVARTGGEEFTVVIGDLANKMDAEKVASDLLASVRRPFSVGNVELGMSASAGVALYPDHGSEGTQLWRAADIAMYRAKYSGGNQYMVVSEEDAEHAVASKAMPKMVRIDESRVTPPVA